MQKTALEMLQAVAGTAVPVQALRTHLGAMGLPGKLALQPIYTMSGTPVPPPPPPHPAVFGR
eukprot:COSAG01_NODE_2260_length_8057_cov_50.825527_7_plen_62_part_00